MFIYSYSLNHNNSITSLCWEVLSGNLPFHRDAGRGLYLFSLFQHHTILCALVGGTSTYNEFRGPKGSIPNKNCRNSLIQAGDEVGQAQTSTN